MKHRFTIGSWYGFLYYDHSIMGKDDDEFLLEIYGKVTKVTSSHVHFIFNKVHSSIGDKEAEKQNDEKGSVALGALKKKRKLPNWK